MSKSTAPLKSIERIATELGVPPREVRIAAASLDLEPAQVRAYSLFSGEQVAAITSQLEARALSHPEAMLAGDGK